MLEYTIGNETFRSEREWLQPILYSPKCLQRIALILVRLAVTGARTRASRAIKAVAAELTTIGPITMKSAVGPCSLRPTCSSFSYPLRTLAGQTLPTDEYDASYRSAAHTLSTGELCRIPLPRTPVNKGKKVHGRRRHLIRLVSSVRWNLALGSRARSRCRSGRSPTRRLSACRRGARRR
jgi:hypothetical protein